MMRRHILILPLCALAGSAFAQQNLHTEIEVDRIVTPQYRDAARPSAITPAVLAMPQQSAQLSAAEYLLGGTATPTIDPLPAVPWRDSTGVTPYRGYVSVGYFPTYNLGANAGYRVADTQKTALDVWMQYSGLNYKGAGYDYILTQGPIPDLSIKRHTLTVGADGASRIGEEGRLSYGADYTYDLVGMPLFYGQKDPDRKSHHAGVRLGYGSRAGNLAYGAKGTFGYFGYSMGKDWTMPKAVSGNLTLSAGYCRDAETVPFVGADIDIELQRNTRVAGVGLNDEAAPINMSETHFTPYYRYAAGPFNAKIGLNLSIAGGHRNAGAVHVAPDVELSYAGQQVAIYCQLKGGERLNGLWRMHMLNPYADVNEAYQRTNVALDGKIGLNVGPFSGFSLGAYLQYARVKDWYSPEICGYWSRMRLNNNFNPGRVGFEARYDYGRLVSVAAAYVTAFASDDQPKTWYEWTDGARSEFTASLTVHPIDALSCNIGYRLRSHRQITGYHIDPDTYYPASMIYGEQVITYTDLDLGSVSDLSARVDYRLTPAITVFAIGENLLSHRYYNPWALQAPGITGSLGIAVKF